MTSRVSPALAALALLAGTSARADLVLSSSMTFVGEGGAIGGGNLSGSGTAFAKDLLNGDGFGVHSIPALNNGTFGNASSWIGNSPDSYAGISFGASQTINSFAFGRDNTGAFTDRAAGTYTVQYTTDTDPATNHATATWTTIGSITLSGGTAFVTNPALRHQFNLNTPVSATGLRLVAPGGAAIDEIELFSTAAPGGIGALTLTGAGSFSISWDGNDGDNFSAAGTVPNNLALASNGATAIASGELGPEISAPFHRTFNLNDGLYGNANSWIGQSGATAPYYAGVILPSTHIITSFAFGRDNGLDEVSGDCCGGQLTDRSQGTYTLQRTLDGTSRETVGTIAYNWSVDAGLGGDFTSHFRHEFELSDGSGGIEALGLRLLVPSSGLGGGTAIDEFEIYGVPVPEPGVAALLALGAGVVARRRRRA